MRSAAKILGWTAGILAGLLVIAATTVYFVATSDYLRGQLEDRISDMTGRRTQVAKVAVDWGWTTNVKLEGIEVANAKWGKAPYMLKVEQVDFDVRLWPLLSGNVMLPRLVLRKPEVQVETGENDQLNWSLGETPVVTGAAKALEPDNRFEAPVIGRLEVTEGKLGYRDPKRKLELDGTVSTATGKAEDEAELALKGKLEGQPLEVRFVGGSVLMLRETEQPYPLDLDVAFGGTKLKMKGRVQDPFKWTGANVDLTLSGPNLSEIYPLLGIPGPPTPPYTINGKLDREAGLWKFVQSKWRVGESDLTGEVIVDERRKPRFLTAKLVSQKLVFEDLAPLVGATPARKTNVSPKQAQTQAQLEATGDLFPNVPLQVEKMRAMNMDVTLDAKRVIAPPWLPVQALAFRVLIHDGNATVKPLTLAVMEGGTIAGEMGIDARTDDPKVKANLRASDIELKNFFRESRYFDATQGKIQGRVSLAGSGRSLAHVMGSANGFMAFSLGGGSVSSLMVSLAGLQIFDALVLYVTGDNRIPIKCAVGRLNFQQGNVVFDRTLLDTQKSVLHVKGQLSLKSQALNAEVDADPKSFDLLDLHGAVMIQGKLRSPQVSLGRVIPIPTPVFGNAKDVPCAGLTQQMLTAP
ncbi:MAG: AsmA family protein [Reyranella sp.]|uniref:AsmA family protein n=1 Tax=Reyranella sp. TaxID=1929291 RepID=UPI0011FB7C5E|nr:AsmA family protein [Reyranella sp.]TAJ96281.1 MAG: AsmA family protein [Reyranella sp.]